MSTTYINNEFTFVADMTIYSHITTACIQFSAAANVEFKPIAKSAGVKINGVKKMCFQYNPALREGVYSPVEGEQGTFLCYFANYIGVRTYTSEEPAVYYH